VPEHRSDARGGLGTVRNAVVLLELLAEGPGYQALTDLAERSSLSLPTTHRLLRSLALAGFVSQDPRTSRYGLGPELTRLSHRYLARLPVVTALAPYLVELRDNLGTTVEVHQLVGHRLVVLDQVDGSEMGTYRRAHSILVPLQGAGGRILAARAADETWTALVAQAPEELRGLAIASRAGWAEAAWLHVPEGAAGRPGEVAVPLVSATGGCEGALVALVPDPDADTAAIGGHLVRAAQAAMRTGSHG